MCVCERERKSVCELKSEGVRGREGMTERWNREREREKKMREILREG